MEYVNIEQFNKHVSQSKYKRSPCILFVDIETFTYNISEAVKHPTKAKTQVFSVTAGYYEKDELKIIHFPLWDDFLNALEGAHRVELWMHNGDGFDNHSLLNNSYLKDLPRYTEAAQNIKGKKAHNYGKGYKDMLNNTNDFVLENRIKSKSKVQLHISLRGADIKTVDSFPRFNAGGIDNMGKTLVNYGFLDSQYQKTDGLDYLKYNLKNDLSYEKAQAIARNIFTQLNSEEIKYIDNDIIILATFYANYNKIYPENFKVNARTFTVNILNEFTKGTSDLTNLQLKNEPVLYYTNYQFKNEVMSDWIRHFYKGGLNFYNEDFLNKTINSKIYSYDLNSSYPNVMYNDKFPTYLSSFSENPETIKLEDNNLFNLWEISIEEFNRLLDMIDSVHLRQYIIKYYESPNKNYYINSNTIRIIERHTKKKVKYLHTLARQTWECLYFDGRDIISENYKIKALGKNYLKFGDNAKELVFNSPSDIVPTDNPYKGIAYSETQVDSAKVIQNSLYGLPALAPKFNMYSLVDGILTMHRGGYKNTERNQIFSIYVTSKALLNLLEPLEDVPPLDFDKYVYYGDTDSLYIDEKLEKYINHDLLNELNLGAWKREHVMDKFFILNHKKYAFNDIEKGIGLRCGGVSEKDFNLNMSFEEFIETQFHAGVEINVTRSVLTEQGTVSVYNARMTLDKGQHYQTRARLSNKVGLSNIIQQLANVDIDDSLYIETPFGSLSRNDVINYQHEANLEILHPMYSFVANTKLIKDKIENGNH